MKQQPATPRHRSTAGFTLVEILFVVALSTTLLCAAVPSTRDAVDTLRTAMAARYLAGRLMEARIMAVNRSASVGLRFVADGPDYSFVQYLDGNGNGVRSLDISLGIDVPLGPAERLAHKFSGVSTGLLSGYPDVDQLAGTGEDGVRIGKARIATMSPDGTATAGTLYLHGRRSQFAVRILGTTGRVRVLQYRPAGNEWIAR